MKISFYQETAVPTTWQAGGVYFIKPTTPPVGAPADYCEIYIVNQNGTVTAHTPTWGEIDTHITNKLSATGALTIVADIAERDALTDKNGEVFVRDASADTTVASGGAKYLWDATNTAWIKVSETESMDVVLNWADIVGKPSFTPAQIDAAVSASHTHTNKTQLDKVGEDGSGNMTYGGNPVSTQWTTNAW